jgi:hypothetical protein
MATRLDPHGSEWQAARWLGGTLAAVCRKAGSVPQAPSFERFETLLRCPDCHGWFQRDAGDILRCRECGYEAPNEGQVYNLLPSAERKELYPGERSDIADFSAPGHEKHLAEGWYELEGIHGNKYRWMGGRAVARLTPVEPRPQRLRIRGHAFAQGVPGEVRVAVNGAPVGRWKLDRTGMFVLEADVPAAAEYVVEIRASPVWRFPPDQRDLTVTLAMIRLIGREVN